MPLASEPEEKFKGPLSAVVVTFNESNYLPLCLERLQSWVSDLVVVDLGSNDASVDVAHRYGARVTKHEWVPFGELAREHGFRTARNEWVITLDPDLILPVNAEDQVRSAIGQNPNAALFTVSYVNHFKGRPIERGRWGGIQTGFPLVAHRNRVEFITSVHSGGLRNRASYEIVEISSRRNPSLVLNHFWADSIKEVLHKAHRYARSDAEARIERGERSSVVGTILAFPFAFFRSYILRQGIRDGLLGLTLSLIAASYESGIRLLIYKKRVLL